MPPHRRADDEQDHAHLRGEDRLDVSGLEKRVAELAVGVIGLRGALESVGAVLKHDVEDLKEELEAQRALAKYARRTWFEVMTWLTLGGLLLADLARGYCYPEIGDEPHPAQACDVVFWTTDHGGGWMWRILGFLLTMALLGWLARRSQVPPDLFSRVPSAAARPRKTTWYYRLTQRRRRS